MIVNLASASYCQELMARIQQTLSAKGYEMSRIQGAPAPFPPNDTDVFKGLSIAILTRQASWASVVKILPDLKDSLSNYNVGTVAALTDSYIEGLYAQYKSRVKARFLKDELFAIRDNATVFQEIMSKHGSVCTFIKSYLPAAAYDPSRKCYIQPADDPLIKCFTDPNSAFKLRGVGLAICCEFFNNIGIDEFKPDVHTTRFLDRTKVIASAKPAETRKAGIAMAETLRVPRKYVDSHIWVFCAEGEGEVCTENNPECNSCWLKVKQPQFCQGC